MFSIKKALVFALKTFNSNFYKMFFIALLSILAAFFIKLGLIKLLGFYFASKLSSSVPLLLQYKVPAIDIFYYGVYFLILVFIFLFFTAAARPTFFGGTFTLARFFPSVKTNVRYIAGIILLELPIIIIAAGFIWLSLYIAINKMDSKWLSLWMLAQFIVLVGGIYLGIIFTRFIFFYIALFENLSLIAAFKRSAHVTKDNRGKLFFLALVIAVFNLIGIITIVGLSVTIPVSVLFLLSVYDQLSQNMSEEVNI